MGVNGHSPIDSSAIEGLLRTGDKHLISIIGQHCGVYHGIPLLAILTFFQLIPYPSSFRNSTFWPKPTVTSDKKKSDDVVNGSYVY